MAYSDQELERMLADLESDSVERKESFKGDAPAKVREAVQLVRNAVMHRTYEGTQSPVRLYWFDDHIEIISPGGPYGIVTAETFGQPGVVDYRNPILAEAMRVLGLVQRFGFGIATARRELRANNQPEPEFVVEPNRVHCTVRLSR